MAFDPTPEQQAIMDATREALDDRSTVNLALDAGAGCGKTATLMLLIEQVLPKNKSALMLAFNRDIKDEINRKLKTSGHPKAKAKTFNGLGYGAWMKRYGISFEKSKQHTLDTNKYARIARWLVETSDHFSENTHTGEQIKDAAQMLSALVRFMMVNTTIAHRDDPDGAFSRDDLVYFVGGNINEPGVLIPHEISSGTAAMTADRYGLFLENRADEDVVFRLVPKAFEAGKMAMDDPAGFKAWVGDYEDIAKRIDGVHQWFDFSDQVYYCVTEKWFVYGHSVVLVDEAQDTSPLDRALVDMHRYTTRNGFKVGMVIMVGDPAQAIYKFRGADGEGFYNSMRFWYTRKALPLSVSFRCPKLVAEIAAEHKAGFRAAEWNPEGEVGLVNLDDFYQMVKDGDACISRVKATLVSTWRELMRREIPAKILGTGLGEPMVRHLRKVAERKDFDWKNRFKHLEAHMNSQVAKLEDRGKEDAAEALRDDLLALKEMLDEIGDSVDNVDDAAEIIEQKLDPDNMPEGGVKLMTAHVSKGQEFETVFNLTPNKFPMIHNNQDDEDLRQEYNLRYVMQTRSAGRLFDVDKDAPSWLEAEKTGITVEVPADLSPTGEQEVVELTAKPEPMLMSGPANGNGLPGQTAPEPALPEIDTQSPSNDDTPSNPNNPTDEPDTGDTDDLLDTTRLDALVKKDTQVKRDKVKTLLDDLPDEALDTMIDLLEAVKAFRAAS